MVVFFLLVFLWWCFCAGVFEVLFFCGGVFVVVWFVRFYVSTGPPPPPPPPSPPGRPPPPSLSLCHALFNVMCRTSTAIL